MKTKSKSITESEKRLLYLQEQYQQIINQIDSSAFNMPRAFNAHKIINERQIIEKYIYRIFNKKDREGD